MSDSDQATLPGAEPDLLTLGTLENHLWTAADKLRGSFDPTNYKNYIFGPLFLKRASDRFEETEVVAEGLGIPVETARDDRDLMRSSRYPSGRAGTTSRTKRQT